MSRKFWLKDIQVHTSPGFASGTFPPIGKLGPHLNVIWGPNGVGKSTLSRAMRSLFWKNTSSSSIEAEGTLQTPESDWNLSFSHGRLVQKRLKDNQEILLPGRNDELSESYWFTLHELLQEDDGSTGAFFKQVRTSMQGGVDIDSACQDAGGITSFSSGISQARRVNQASEDLKQVRNNQRDNQNIQEKIENLQKDVAQSETLFTRKTLLENAKALGELTEEIEEQEQKLSLYSPSMVLIDKSSPKRLEELLASHEKAKHDEFSYTQDRDRLQREFGACGFSKQDLDDREKAKRIANRYDEYKDALDVQKTSVKEFASAKSKLLEWEEEHFWLRDDIVEDNTLQTYVQTLKTLAQTCEPLRCDVAANKRLLDELGERVDVERPANDLVLLQMRLTDWMNSYWKLQGTAKEKSLRRGTKRWLLILVLGIGSLSSYLGIAVEPVFSLLGFILILFSVVLLLPSSVRNNGYKKAEDALQQARQEVEILCKQLNIDGPSTWTLESCQKKSVELYADIVASQRLEELNQRRELAQGHLKNAKERLRTWTSAWTEASKALALKEDEGLLEGAQFFHFAERLQTWSDLRLEFVKTQGLLSSAQTEAEQKLFLLQAELNTKESDLSALKAKNDSVIERFAEAQSLLVKIGENEERLLSANKQVLASESALRAFWESIQLEYGNVTELAELVASLDQWGELQSSLHYKKGLYAKRSNDSPEALTLARGSTISELTDALNTLKKEQLDLDEKRERLGGLRATFESLKFGSDLSTAQLNKETALSELDAYRNEQVMARMVATLAEELRAESEKEFQPQVLNYASRWLSNITNHRYTLSANNEGFFVKDTIMTKTYTLEQVSSGNRIQLLFSIRMAFITMQEETSGVKLPLFLDELLANSDDQRAAAIVDAIGEIAKERQIFYVTAQRDEVEKLSAIGPSMVEVIALEDIFRKYRVAKTPLKRYVYAKKHIPDPLEDYQEYAQLLGVEGASLWGIVEQLHSWHLLVNSADLYGYLQQGLEHIGQLVSATTGQIPSFAFRLQLLKAAQEKAQQGRSRRLHLADLDDPALDLNRGAKFWTQIQDVVGPDGCTGNELLEAIEDKRIQRFTDANLEMVSNWLFENRFSTDKKCKTSSEILEDLFVEFADLTVGSEEERMVGRYLDAVVG